MAKDTSAKLNRLKRIEGQVRGVAQMVEDDRYCMDILHQIAAIKSALAKVETQVLKDHAACCVAEAISSGDEDEQRGPQPEAVALRTQHVDQKRRQRERSNNAQRDVAPLRSDDFQHSEVCRLINQVLDDLPAFHDQREILRRIPKYRYVLKGLTLNQ